MRLALHCFCTLLLLSLTTSVFATDYTFTGNGSWNDPNNWAGGLIPPGSLPPGSTITINGTTTIGSGCPSTGGPCSDPGALGENEGTIIIAAGGSLAFQNYTQFQNGGPIIVNGTLINNTTLEGYSTGVITVNGIFNNKSWFGNQGLITVNSGGTLNNQATLDNTFVSPGQIIVNSGGTINNIASGAFKPGNITNNGGTITNTGLLCGMATISGGLSVNAGTLAPDHATVYPLSDPRSISSNLTSSYSISGDYTASSTAIHNFQVGGTSSGSYDLLSVSGTVTLDGTLNVSFVSGFTSSANFNLPIITGTIVGKFSNVNIPSGCTIVYTNNSVNLKSVNNPSFSFTGFTVTQTSSGQTLAWSVQNEQNIVRYDIEKSADNITYNTITSVNASGLGQYNYTDAQSENNCYYRIKCVDNNTQITYSNVVNFTRRTFSFQDFGVIKQGTGELLNWRVQNEQQIIKYELQKGKSQTSYTTFATVNATGAGQYTYTDNQTENYTYYRIKSTDENSNIVYSNNVFYANTVPNVFSGTGDWSDSTKWSKRVVPASLLSGDTIFIVGNCTFNMSSDFTNNGVIVVAPNSTLTLNSDLWTFENDGTFITNGSVNNNCTFTCYGGIDIYGTFTNAAFLQLNSLLSVIESGGIFINSKGGKFLGSFTVKSGGIYTNNGSIAGNGTIKGDLTNVGTMAGNPTIQGNLTNTGTLAPGNSPGTVTVTGNYTATSTAVHNFEVAGTSSGAYDLLSVSGTVNLSGTLNVSLYNGYKPGTTDNIPIITGNINGTFASVNLPAQYVLVYNLNSVVLKSASTLPVAFVYLDAQKEGNGVKLIWTVQSEHDVARYEVEKGTDGHTFTDIGSITTAGLTQYNFTDALSATKCFYRIKSVDKDGKYKYSPVVVFNERQSLINLMIFPTPASSEIVVQHATAAIDSKITIIAIDGKRLLTIVPGFATQQTEINISTLKAGTYILHYDNEGAVQTTKFIKQ